MMTTDDQEVLDGRNPNKPWEIPLCLLELG